MTINIRANFQAKRGVCEFIKSVLEMDDAGGPRCFVRLQYQMHGVPHL